MKTYQFSWPQRCDRRRRGTSRTVASWVSHFLLISNQDAIRGLNLEHLLNPMPGCRRSHTHAAHGRSHHGVAHHFLDASHRHATLGHPGAIRVPCRVERDPIRQTCHLPEREEGLAQIVRLEFPKVRGEEPGPSPTSSSRPRKTSSAASGTGNTRSSPCFVVKAFVMRTTSVPRSMSTWSQVRWICSPERRSRCK